MKKIISIITVIMIITTILSSCGNSTSNANSDDASNSIETTEKVTTKELTYSDILNKAVDYLKKYISLDECDIDYGDKKIKIKNYSNDRVYLSDRVNIGGDIQITLDDYWNTTTIGELINQGCIKGNQNKAYKKSLSTLAKDVYMLYNKKYFHIGLDTFSEEEDSVHSIRYVDLKTDKKAVEFEFSSIDANSDIEEVVARIGSPNVSTEIKYIKKSDKYTITLGYGNLSGLYADFTFEYDYKTDSSKMKGLYIGE